MNRVPVSIWIVVALLVAAAILVPVLLGLTLLSFR